MRTIIWDLDGCLFDERHRNEHAVKKDWPEYYKTVHLDTPLHHRLYHACIETGCRVVVISGREENCLAQTLDCMERHGIKVPDLFMMRAVGDERRSVEIKAEHVHALRESGHTIIAAFDDRPDLIKMYLENGVSNAILMGYETSYHLQDVMKKVYDEAERLGAPIPNAKSNHEHEVANETAQRTMVRVQEELLGELKRLNSSVDEIMQFMVDRHKAEQDSLMAQRNWKENRT